MAEMFDAAQYSLMLPALPPLAVGLLIAALGLAVLVRERASRVSLAFCLVTTSTAIWLLAFGAMYSTASEPLARRWVNLAHLGVVFIPSAVTVFTLAITERLWERRRLAWASLALSGLFFLGVVSTDWFVSGLHRYDWGFYPRYGPLSLPFLGFFFVMLFGNLRAYWTESRTAASVTRQKRFKGLLLAFCIGYLASVDFLASYGIPVYPIGYLPVLGFVGLIARATWRYRLVDITPAFAADHIIKTLADGLVVLDHAGSIRIVNPAACRLFGKPEADLIGRPVVAAGQGVFTADLLDLLARHDVVREYEIALPVRREGIEVLSLTASVLRNETQEPVATVCVLRDQTQRKRADEQLRRNERQLAEAQQLARLGSWVWDIAANTVTWSAELYRIYGLAPREFAATYEAFLERVHLEDRETVTQAFKHAQTDHESFSFYHRIVRPDGTERILHARGDVVVDDRGRPIRLFGTGQDVTDLKRAEETLKQAEDQLRQTQRLEAMGKFAGEVAHGFNQLLATMTRNAVYLVGGLDKHERLRSSAEELKHAADQASMLTRHLLAFSSNQTLKPRVLDLNVLVTGLRGIVEWLVKKEIKLVTVLDPGLGWVKVDPAQVELIVMNLAARAQDAMPRGGTLTIKTADVKLDRPMPSFHGVVPPGRYVLLELADTGDGMDPATLAHLFEPFSATSGINPEIGLRLATVYGIVKQSNGFIVATSEPARGTNLKVYLPGVSSERAA